MRAVFTGLGLLVLLAGLGGLRASAEDAEAAANHIGFVAENLFETVNGRFHDFAVREVRVDPADPAGSFVEVEVDVASIDTGIERRDEHLRSDDFFDVATHPTAKVRVTGAEASGLSADGNPLYTASFELTIRGTTKTVEGWFEWIDATPPAVVGGLELDRLAFGVGAPEAWWNPASIGETIPVHFRAVLAAPAAP